MEFLAQKMFQHTADQCRINIEHICLIVVLWEYIQYSERELLDKDFS
jgi:hypothetical protein